LNACIESLKFNHFYSGKKIKSFLLDLTYTNIRQKELITHKFNQITRY